MLPVFTSPRGSRKAILLSESTEYNLRASAKDAVLDDPRFWADANPFDAEGGAGAAAALLRTKSAQDFGAALTAGGEADDVCSEPLAVAAPSCAVVAFSNSTMACSEALTLEGVVLAEVLRCDAEKAGTAGLMGINGTAGRVAVLICAVGVCALDAEFGGSADEGVVGCVESDSEGASEFRGVSSSDAACTVGA